MRKVDFGASVRIIFRGLKNWFTARPIVVSFEVTDSCTCNCLHCDHGGPRDDSHNLRPGDFSAYMDELQPCVVQLSGGEPLLRADLEEIVQAIKQPSGCPYVILVSNWSEMTESRYVTLTGAGVDQFTVSLDFPDERHDSFRGLPGLYARLNHLVPTAGVLGHDNIVLNCCITRENLPCLNDIADKAREWGVNVSYSAYTFRRTGSRYHFIEAAADLAALEAQLARIKARMNSSHWIVNSRTTIDATLRFLQQGRAAGCQAGRRFLVVTSDGHLQPCSMQFKRFDLGRRKAMIREFTESNTCDECYVSIRSYLDKSLLRLFYESVAGFFSFRTSLKTP